ncbi:MAG: glycosyltransferase [Planctomycetes bacterium]|nr:glycosyltransferase [Planctomycetota bacterium]
MQTFISICTGWLVLTVLVWGSRHVQLLLARRKMAPLTDGMFASDVGTLPTVSFIVAGKDEAENIENCLTSMLAQDYPSLEVIAANDRSADATGPIMDRIAAGSNRLTVIHVKELAAGWLGKNNAMRTAVERAKGDWFCFTDADCTQVSKRSLRIAMNYALQEKLDFLSVLPAHDAQSFWEAVVQPACSGIMMIWFNPMKVNNPKSRAAYANGAFMLMSRACYHAIGRHEAVKAEFNEDMHMARLAKEKGLRLRVMSNEGLYTVRMYGSLKATWAGWSRIFFGCFGTLRRLVLAMTVVVMVSLMPWIALGAFGVSTLVAAEPENLRNPLFAAAAACLAQLTVMWRFYALNHTPAWYGTLYPLGAVVGLGALINAVRRLRNRATITWRGTTYAAAVATPVARRSS